MSQSNLAEQISLGENKLAKHAVNIHKFGGSSLATTACIERVVNIIRQNCQLNDVIVVSANGKTTDSLFALLHLSNKANDQFEQALLDLHEQQKALINSLLKSTHAQHLLQLLAQDIEQLRSWLSQISNHQSDILAFGELWSARLLSAVLNSYVCPSYYLDARDFLQIDNELNCLVEHNTSASQYRLLQQAHKLVVVTGYIAKDKIGTTCTLGRNGSDYSATIMSSLTHANNVTLWTDVDGIYSADPRLVPNARKLHRLPNEVAKELGRLGNPVLHANTLKPLTEQRTHLHITSSFVPQTSGTEIGKFGLIAKQELSVTYLNNLLLVSSTSLQRKLTEQFPVICHNIKLGFVVIEKTQQKVVKQWLAKHDNEISFQDVAIIATVGFQVAKRGNIKARFKRALKSSTPLHILDSTNEHSVLAILADECTTELLNNVHHDVTKEARQLGLVVAGLGNIGQRFLSLLPQQLKRISALENLHLVGLVTSTKALINVDGLEAQQAQQLFSNHAQNYDHQQLLSWLSNHPYDELIVVDITPSKTFSDLYLPFFKQGIHLISANKWAASSPTEHYDLLKNTAKHQQSLWLGNTTVGAGLPVNFAINDLLSSGDNIQAISGIFSGTLSWLFQTYDGSVGFGELISNALAQGITEPDPRDDLSGRDVQRKLLILVRAAGFNLSLEDIHCQNLVPKQLQNLSKDAFLAGTNELDHYFAQQLKQAKKQQGCLRYVARFSANNTGITAQVSLEILSTAHAFANLTPGDNIFQIKSQWYHDNPLIIQGPGAGRDVTAGGLHSDLVNICQQLAAKKTQVKIKGII